MTATRICLLLVVLNLYNVPLNGAFPPDQYDNEEPTHTGKGRIGEGGEGGGEVDAAAEEVSQAERNQNLQAWIADLYLKDVLKDREEELLRRGHNNVVGGHNNVVGDQRGHSQHSADSSTESRVQSEVHSESTNQNSDTLLAAKRFSEFLGGRRKRYSEFLGGKKRYSEFLGGKKRFSEFLGGKRGGNYERGNTIIDRSLKQPAEDYYQQEAYL